ncbi:aminoglycoside phosphotransferase [Magnetococcus marinus MC-1]|uniref:Aminoglycoside phosphotransferase n=1 Tax=Magnetococcus marinus (strain ATCC BAA-1437 / JCM 17883 / MC-1) TaxID=156889 RepID=A0L687_MAGMM|nr:phosphotransferase [Magnetococcus marinus]ABK43480.1 aminoglycoside phosphotransferase [Magnetococcus marinus MC-1]
MLDNALRAFAERHAPHHQEIVQVAGDASFRRYYRLVDNPSRIVMDAPPDKEDSHPFVAIAGFLREHGVLAPQVLQADYEQGLFLLEDFGDITFARALQQGVAPERLYGAAVDALLTLQATPLEGGTVAHQRAFDPPLFAYEASLLTEWYIPGVMGYTLSGAEQAEFKRAFDELLRPILAQPQVLVHRDYHSRNLMWLEGQVGVLDFQDAVMGPITYDLASLLRDCYVAWDRPFRHAMMQQWLSGATQRLGYAPTWASFERAFDWMAIQRNLKAVGIFGRLALRDGKFAYLDDVPRTMGYVWETLARYPELGRLHTLLQRTIPPGTEPSSAQVAARQTGAL